jgi:hypothetical protein
VVRVFSNGLVGDFVCNPFEQMLFRARHIRLAAPYFTEADSIVKAALGGRSVQLLVCLNSVTHPAALRRATNTVGLTVRYYTSRFHAKIFIFDDVVLLGSSNLTDGGLRSNREAVIRLDAENDPDVVDEVRALFLELWDTAPTLTDSKLSDFERAWRQARGATADPDDLIENMVGREEPRNISVVSRTQSGERIFLNELHRLVLEQYRPAYREVTEVLVEGGFRRTDLAGISAANETNRFLSWVRQTHAAGEESWREAPLRDGLSRRELIEVLGAEWARTADSKVPDDYLDWLRNVEHVFASSAALNGADKGALTQGFMSLHAFEAQSRFTLGGAKKLPDVFWKQNQDDVERVRRTISHLLNGSGDFIYRLHDVLYRRDLKLGLFGKFCALELYGTVRPDDCPPMNGRMAKGLRYLGFNVPPNG